MTESFWPRPDSTGLGLSERITQHLAQDYMVPAPCQGIIAIECRKDDTETRNLISAITHADTETAAVFERSFWKLSAETVKFRLDAAREWHLGKISADSVFIDMEENRVSRNTWKCDSEKASAEGSLMAKDLMERAGLYGKIPLEFKIWLFRSSSRHLPAHGPGTKVSITPKVFCLT